MAVKKTELYSSLWASCDALRGGMDASQYKDYILTLLFMKYSWLYGVVEYELIPLLKEYWFDEPMKVKDWSENLRSTIK